MVTRLVQSICIHNQKNNQQLFETCVLREHIATNFDNILHVIAKDNNILELQGHLEHFIKKLATIK
jgi:hypothetical protein